MAITSLQLVGPGGHQTELTKSDVVSLDVITQLFASRPLSWQAIRSKYTALRPVASSGMNMFLSIREFGLHRQSLKMQHCNTQKACRPIQRTIPLGRCRGLFSQTFRL